MKQPRCVIANRGEIARRIARAARKRGYQIAVISTEHDRASLIRDEVDDVLEVSSFLSAPEIVSAAKKWGAQFLHPGYGFLSESSDFASRVEKAGINFVGPTAKSMQMLGGKESAKRLAAKCNVPVLPTLESAELRKLPAAEWGRALGRRGIVAPFLVKASAGGGGRGMRVVENVDELPDAVRRASEEARAGFGDGTVFIERFVKSPRHIEVQMFGDGHGGGVFLGERECSIQRRHQKVIEEAPSVAVSKTLREKLGRAALQLVRETRYRSAGTVEFLLEGTNRFWFLEVNTRIQVEHTVTEVAYDLDLVSAQFELAEGRWPTQLPSPKRFTVLRPKRHVIEARILAENPRAQFLPSPGLIHRYAEPSASAIRIDSGVAEGRSVEGTFDSMIAKLIVSGRNRGEATKNLLDALHRFVIHGCHTNIGFLANVIEHRDFIAARCTTDWIERKGETLVRSRLTQQQFDLLSAPNFLDSQVAKPTRSHRPGTAAIFARQVIGSAQPLEIRVDAATVSYARGEYWITARGETLVVSDESGTSAAPVMLASSGNQAQPVAGAVCAPMAGKVLEVRVSLGQSVKVGDLLCVVESMKMQLEVRASHTGVVSSLEAKPGQIVRGGGILATISER